MGRSTSSPTTSAQAQKHLNGFKFTPDKRGQVSSYGPECKMITVLNAGNGRDALFWCSRKHPPVIIFRWTAPANNKGAACVASAHLIRVLAPHSSMSACAVHSPPFGMPLAFGGGRRRFAANPVVSPRIRRPRGFFFLHFFPIPSRMCGWEPRPFQGGPYPVTVKSPIGEANRRLTVRRRHFTVVPLCPLPGRSPWSPRAWRAGPPGTNVVLCLYGAWRGAESTSSLPVCPQTTIFGARSCRNAVWAAGPKDPKPVPGRLMADRRTCNFKQLAHVRRHGSALGRWLLHRPPERQLLYGSVHVGRPASWGADAPPPGGQRFRITGRRRRSGWRRSR